jgi:hypothetical protein
MGTNRTSEKIFYVELVVSGGTHARDGATPQTYKSVKEHARSGRLPPPLLRPGLWSMNISA